jgi:hypothetical protein
MKIKWSKNGVQQMPLFKFLRPEKKLVLKKKRKEKREFVFDLVEDT